MTVYVDKQIGWPLKMSVSMSGDFPMSIDINLTEPDVPLASVHLNSGSLSVSSGPPSG